MNRDKLIGMAGTHPAAMRQAMYAVIDRTQDRPEVQLQAIAMALVATCEALNIDVKELLNTVEIMKNDLDGNFTSTFEALKAYARYEIGGRF
jgi:hypothetical protein